MGSAQREATAVAIGLVILATIVIVYLLNEPTRRETAAETKVEESADRGVALYVQYCVQCHGEDGMATGRIGIPLNTPQNQVEDETAWSQREEIIRTTIQEGRGQIMPAWAQDQGGPLNSQQVNDLVNLIHQGLWDDVHEATLEANNGQIPTPEPLPTPDVGVELDPAAQQGQELYQSQGCAACHSIDGADGTGPTWQGMFGSEVTLESGETVTADEEYIRESILNPSAKVHQGFAPVMPPYEGRLNDDQINALIAFIQALGEGGQSQ